MPTFAPGWLRLILPLLALVACRDALAAPDPWFDIARRSGSTLVFTTPSAPAADALDQSLPPMLLRHAGALGSLAGKPLITLLSLVTIETNPPVDATPVARLTLKPPVAKAAPAIPPAPTILLLSQTREGEYNLTKESPAPSADVATRPGPTPPRAWRVRREPLDRLLATIDPYWGSFSLTRPQGPGQPPDELRPGVVFKLTMPPVAGRFQLDKQTVTDRIEGTALRYPPGKPDLNNAQFFVRLPRPAAGTPTRERPGLMVWMDPSPAGQPPAVLHDACDALNLVCIGAADSGNSRPALDRVQLALDAVATASRYWPIDPARVYLVGLSGGGKVSCVALAAFPEVFSGAAAIVGFSWFESIPTGDGRTIWRADFIKPQGPRLDLYKVRRLAAVTGSQDMNYKPILAGVKLYEREKLPVKLFDIPNLGHTFPAAADLTKVVQWLDEPAQARATETRTAAAAALSKLDADSKANPTINRRPALLELIRAHPYAPAAWAACDELK